MIDRVDISSLQIGEPATIAGFVETTRNHPQVAFADVSDLTGVIQTVYASDFPNFSYAIFESLGRITRGSAVEVFGQVVEKKQPKKPSTTESLKLTDRELRIADFVIHSLADPSYPIGGSTTDVATRLDWRHLDLRERSNGEVFRIQTTLLAGIREFCVNSGWTEQMTPKLVGTPSEGGSEVFSLEYFGKKAYLAQSPQFYKQMAIAAGYKGFFEIGPAFRAENSNTPHHATEFTSIDAEIAWISDHHDVMSMEEALLRHAIGAVVNKHGTDISRMFNVHNELPNAPFPRIPLADARAMVEASGYTLSADEKDLNRRAEGILCELIKAKYGSDFVFVTDYPINARPFYHMRHEDNPGLTKSFDLLYKGVEITTGAQREHRYDRLHAQALEKGLNPDLLKDYLNFFKFGCPPHGGIGIGLARLMLGLTGLGNIKEVTYLPRTPNRLNP